MVKLMSGRLPDHTGRCILRDLTDLGSLIGTVGRQKTPKFTHTHDPSLNSNFSPTHPNFNTLLYFGYLLKRKDLSIL